MSERRAAAQNKELSSANNRVKRSSCFAISLIYTRNNRSPSTDPWGAPARMDFIVEAQDLRVTFFYFLLVSYLITGENYYQYHFDLT